MIKVTPEEMKILAGYIRNITGITLSQDKAYLIETRLSKLAEELGCATYSEFYYKARADATKSLERRIVDAVTTKETLFFRDQAPFQLLQHKILPDLIDARKKNRGSLPVPIRIWSAACSTGQEIYSVAIVLRELLPDFRSYNIKLLGTDISDEAIASASYGAYNQFEIQRGLPQDKLQKFFTKQGDRWRIKDEIRSLAMFKKANLLESLAGLGRFDIILCRNVAIYFTLEDRTKLFNKIASLLEPDGYLIIGSTEHLSGVCDRFEPKRYLRSVFYQLKGRKV